MFLTRLLDSKQKIKNENEKPPLIISNTINYLYDSCGIYDRNRNRKLYRWQLNKLKLKYTLPYCFE